MRTQSEEKLPGKRNFPCYLSNITVTLQIYQGHSKSCEQVKLNEDYGDMNMHGLL